MARIQGNLALKPRMAEPERRLPPVRTRRVVTPLFPGRADPVEPTRVRSVRRGIAKVRLRACLVTIAGVVAFSAVFGTLLYKQSRILAAQFRNTEMEQRIEQLHQDQAMLEEEIMKTLDLDQVRLAAIERLGMQEAGRNKIVSVGIARADLVVVNPAGTDGAPHDESLRLDEILGDLEGFFKRLR